MNKNEYIIVNKSAIEKRIENLELIICDGKPSGKDFIEAELLIEIISQSIPLIPEIEKAFEAGNKRGWSGYPNTDNWTMPTKQDYIDNLKLEI